MSGRMHFLEAFLERFSLTFRSCNFRPLLRILRKACEDVVFDSYRLLDNNEFEIFSSAIFLCIYFT